MNVGRLRKNLEKLRPPSVSELLLSNDGDHILEGCLTNFFVVCHKVSTSECYVSLVSINSLLDCAICAILNVFNRVNVTYVVSRIVSILMR